MFLFRAFLIWLLIIFAETVHGTIRQMFLAPLIGDFTARRIAFIVGLALIFTIAYFFIVWIRAANAKQLFAAGFLWAGLTLIFEIALGFLFLGYTSERVFEDYDVTRGGLMAFGIVFLIFAPFLAAKLREKFSRTVKSF